MSARASSENLQQFLLRKTQHDEAAGLGYRIPSHWAAFIDTGKAFLAFRHLPLAIHRNGQKAAEAADCASEQGKFWEMYDFFFAPQFSFNSVDWMTSAQIVAPDVARFELGLAVGNKRSAIGRDVVGSQKDGTLRSQGRDTLQFSEMAARLNVSAGRYEVRVAMTSTASDRAGSVYTSVTVSDFARWLR